MSDKIMREGTPIDYEAIKEKFHSDQVCYTCGSQNLEFPEKKTRGDGVVYFVWLCKDCGQHNFRDSLVSDQVWRGYGKSKDGVLLLTRFTFDAGHQSPPEIRNVPTLFSQEPTDEEVMSVVLMTEEAHNLLDAAISEALKKLKEYVDMYDNQEALFLQAVENVADYFTIDSKSLRGSIINELKRLKEEG